MAYKDLEKKRAANRRGRLKLMAKDPGYNARYLRQWRQKNLEKARARDVARNIRDKDKLYARQAVYYAVKTRKIAKPELCSWCGRGGIIEADHYKGYDKKHRLTVRWLCRPCHRLITNKI